MIILSLIVPQSDFWSNFLLKLVSKNHSTFVFSVQTLSVNAGDMALDINTIVDG